MTWFTKLAIGVASLLCTSAIFSIAVSPSLAVQLAERPMTISQRAIPAHVQVSWRTLIRPAPAGILKQADRRDDLLQHG